MLRGLQYICGAILFICWGSFQLNRASIFAMPDTLELFVWVVGLWAAVLILYLEYRKRSNHPG